MYSASSPRRGSSRTTRDWARTRTSRSGWDVDPEVGVRVLEPRAADAVVLLEHGVRDPGLFEADGGADPAEAGADDRDAEPVELVGPGIAVPREPPAVVALEVGLVARPGRRSRRRPLAGAEHHDPVHQVIGDGRPDRLDRVDAAEHVDGQRADLVGVGRVTAWPDPGRDRTRRRRTGRGACRRR